MAKFTYEVQDMNGKKLRGSIEADKVLCRILRPE